MEVPNLEDEVMCKQSIDFPGVNNARQLGGYMTVDGRRVKNDVLYRTGMLMNAKITSEEMQKRLGIAYVIDFRTDVEREEMPDPVMPQIPYRVIDISPKEPMLELYEDYKNPISDCEYQDKNLANIQGMDYNRCQEAIYHFYALNPIARKGYREFFDVLLEHDPQKGAVLFHCYQGKDRTGIAAVLLLSALGVQEDVIIQDYLLTNVMMQKEIFAALRSARKEMHTVEVMRVLSRIDGVELAMLETYLGTVEKEYGSMQTYLRDGLDLSESEIKRLRELYTKI